MSPTQSPSVSSTQTTEKVGDIAHMLHDQLDDAMVEADIAAKTEKPTGDSEVAARFEADRRERDLLADEDEDDAADYNAFDPNYPDLVRTGKDDSTAGLAALHIY